MRFERILAAVGLGALFVGACVALDEISRDQRIDQVRSDLAEFLKWREEQRGGP